MGDPAGSVDAMIHVCAISEDGPPPRLPRGTKSLSKRVLRRFMGTLRAIHDRVAPAFYERHPTSPRACETCAFRHAFTNPKWKGSQQTAFNILSALRDGRPFWCHHDMEKKKGDYVPDYARAFDRRGLDLSGFRPCAGWWVLQGEPGVDVAFEDAALAEMERPPKR